MARAVELLIKIATDASNATKGIDQATSGFGKFKSGMEGLALPATVVAGGIALMGKGAVDAASRAEQAMGGLDAVFGAQAATVTSWAKDSVDSVGLSTAAYAELATKTGASLQNMGLDSAAAATGTQDLITMGADLAATFGGDTQTAVEALGSALRGEADPAERFGLNLSAAAVNAQMAADGTDKLTGEAKSAAKAQAILALATEQSAGATGKFADEADSAEGAAQRSAAAYENAQAALGQALLPVVTAVSTALQAMSGWISENTTLVLVLAGVFGGLAVAILAVNLAMKAAAAAQAAWTAIQAVAKGVTVAFTAVQAALNAVLAANPVMLVVLAVAALVAGIILLWNNCEGFRNAVLAIWTAIAAGAKAAWDAISSAALAAWNTITGAAKSAWDAISSLVSTVASAIGGFVSGAGDVIRGIWDAISAAAKSAWDAVSSAVSTAVDAVVGFVQGIIDKVGAVWDAIQAAGEAVWGPIADAADAAFQVILGIIDTVSGAIGDVVGAIQSALDWASDLWDKIVNMPSPEPPSGGVPPVTAASSPTLATASSPSLARAGLLARTGTATAPSGSAAPTIIIQGALDPDAVARQVAAILGRRQRRIGGPELGGGA